MVYLKRQYGIKQYIGNGIQIELSPPQRSSPPAVTSHE